MDKNHYTVLGVPPNATRTQIYEAYRGSRAQLQGQLQRLKDAYIVLMDPATRAVHDYTIANSAAQATGSADTTAQQDDSSSKNMTTDKARFNGPGLLSPAPQMNWGGSALGLKGMETGVAFDNSQMDVPPTPVTPVTPLELKWGRAELPSRGGGGR
ncbi:uncharacterized protein EHS24_008883 [Apiotrichum porosum]|uniref:J domain-containing protein n=1 Tax=Apiotrichum porosum TaxID=105984 RepID=A0A427XNK7_9TREE|nr:uncharacterized protein EHS24_008883 [Apiotrichum porosum]RSH80307.1 hypothetical protein EHS24_008883 [Apiotrichum porosum]